MKQERHLKIKELIKKSSVENQGQLLSLLAGEGFKVTQATVSRDILELGLAKSRDKNGKLTYSLPEQSQFKWMANQMLESAKQAQNMIVLKVSPGSANAVAAAIDKMGWSELIGSVAGDDTVLLATEDNRAAAALLRRVRPS